MLNLPGVLAGCKVFPCIPGDKHPATQNGWRDASNDPRIIAEWERVNPGFNWALATGLSDLFVIDIDPNGIATWEDMQERSMELRAAVARSYTVRTPRGGFHHYWRGQGPSTASRIADGIDTRGGIIGDDGQIKSGGYVLLPGSRTSNGSYTEIGGVLEPLPSCVLSIIPERKGGAVHGLDRTPDLDQPRNVQWALDLLGNYVREGRVSLQGKGGNNVAFQVAASILDKAISPARCYELLDEHWNPHCSPPWDDWELETLVANAARYGEDTGKGAKGFQDNASAFEKFAGYVAEPEPTTEKRSRFKPMRLSEARKDVRPASWLIPGFIPSAGTGILYGLSGSYKTFIGLDWALSLAHGVAGQWGAPPVKHKVLFLAGESAYALQQERVDAWCEWQGVNPDDAQFVIVRGVPAYGDKEGWEEVRDGLLELEFRPEFVVIDTLTRVMSGMDENSNNDAKLVLKHCEEISQHYGCFVLSTGHTGKDESRGLRGAQVFLDNSDAVIYAKKSQMGTTLTIKKLKEVDIPEQSFYLEKKEFGNSIVLTRTEKAPEEELKSGTKTSWSDPKEIIQRLAKHGGRLAHGLLVAEIAGDLSIDKDKVTKELRRRTEAHWLRDSNDDRFWRIPTEKEFDL